MLRNDLHVGAPRSRVDGPAKVTGSATYAAEFAAPDLLHGHIVESAIARGRISAIDIAAAEAVPGVVRVFTHDNRPKTAWFSYKYQDQVGPPGSPFRPLYSDEIQYSGQPIALVVAESFDVARHAASLVRVDYERQPHQTSLDRARNESYEPPKKRMGIAPPPKPRGDAVKAFAEAPIRVSAEYTIATEHHNPMEPHATTVVWHGDGKITVHDKTQGVQNSQAYVSAVFGLSSDDVRVVSPYVGGGFGSGLRPQHQLFLAVMASLGLERSVKLELTRQQMFSHVHRPETINTLSLGAGQDGKLTSIEHLAVAATSQFEDHQEVVVNWSGLLYPAENVDLRYELAKLDTYSPGRRTGTGRAARAVCARERNGRARHRQRHRPDRIAPAQLRRARRERRQALHLQGTARLLSRGRRALRLEQARRQAWLDARRPRADRLGHGERRLGSQHDEDLGPRRAEHRR